MRIPLLTGSSLLLLFFDLDMVVLWAENLPQKDPSHLPAEATRSSLGRTRAAKPEEVQTGFQQHLWR